MRTVIYKFSAVITALLFFFTAQAQTDVDDFLANLGLNQALYPPEDILKTKSLVLLSVPLDDAPNEWQKILDEMQLFFAQQGVNAVAYYPLDRYQIFKNQMQELPDFTFKRNLQNLIFFSAESLEGPFFFAITTFNGQNSLYNKGAAAYARLTTDLSTIWQELEGLFKTDQFQRTNLLVNENPELFYPSLETGVVARSIPPQVKEFKIAVRPLDLGKYRTDARARAQFHQLFQSDSLRKAVEEQNRYITSIAVDSTNTISLVDLDEDVGSLRRDDYIYELKMVQGKESEVYEWINFPDRPQAQNRTVYKFFLDDLRTNTIYVGKEWDASPNWFEALAQFVDQIRQAALQEED